MKQKTMVKWGLIALVLLVGVVVGVFLVRTNFAPPPEEAQPQVEERQETSQEFQLYFSVGDGSHLAAETRILPACEEENACIEALFSRLINGPEQSGLLPVIPAEAKILGVRQEAGVVIVDLSKEFFTRHPGGTLSELLTVYSLANTLAENFPHLRQIRLLQEGSPKKTLKGHVSLQQPILADFAFSRPPQREASPAKKENTQ